MIAKLTAREIQVMRLVLAGKRNCEIAIELGLSQKTISAHKFHVREKLKVTGTYAELLVATRAYLDQLTAEPSDPPREGVLSPESPAGSGVSEGAA